MISKKNLGFLILFLASGCSVKTSNVFGCYELKNSKGFNLNYYLKLSKDSTYYFLNQGDLDNRTQEGRWEIKRNKIVLTSYIQSETLGYLIEQYDNKETQIRINLYDINKKPLLNKKKVYMWDEVSHNVFINLKDNIYTLRQSKLPTHFTFGAGSAYNEIKVSLRDPKSNIFNIYLVPNSRGFFQTNEKLNITRTGSLKYGLFNLEKGECSSN